MGSFNVALFGEAGKGDFRKPYYFESLPELADFMGEPPTREARGIEFAIQALLYSRGVLFFRVHEEGFSVQDYLRGFSVLEQSTIPQLAAICLPGVGNDEIMNACQSVCQTHKSCLIVTEKDLYDYLTR